MAGKVLHALWFKLKGKTYRAVGKSGSVTLAPDTEAKALAHIAGEHGVVVKDEAIRAAPSEDDLRAAIVQRARWAIAHEPQIHYPPGDKRTQGVPSSALLPQDVDCSQFVTWMYRLAGAPDPSGLGYGGDPYTGSLLAHCKIVTDPKPGDLPVYGPGTGDHVAMVLEAGSDPLLVSHGQERGPIEIRHSQELAGQEEIHGANLEVRFLRLPAWA